MMSFGFKGSSTVLRPTTKFRPNGSLFEVFVIVAVDDSAKRGLTQFWELFTVFPRAPEISIVSNIATRRYLGFKLDIRFR